MVKKYDPEAFHHHPNPFVRFIEKKRVQTILKLLKTQSDDPVLEVGCGAGNIVRKVNNGKLFGVDISPSLLLRAKEKIDGKVLLFQGDAQDLPCKNRMFTSVICSEVLEHLLDPVAVLGEISRVLRTHGVAVISIPNEALINRIKKIFIRLGVFEVLLKRRGEYPEMAERMDDEWHLQIYTLKQWTDLFSKFFRVTQLRKVPFVWMPLRYVVSLEKVD
jgi:ubiquinone/menaquinone biosynthesis C-methylase UbiE